MDVVFVHGRSQELKNETKLHEQWRSALGSGFGTAKLPERISTVFPYFGNLLATLVKEYQELPAPRSLAIGPYEEFLGEFAEEVIQARSNNSSFGSHAEGDLRDQSRGPLNWEWIQSALEFIDKHCPGIGKETLQRFTHDVFLYLTVDSVRVEVERRVELAFSAQTKVVIGHSLGSIVAYNILRRPNKSKAPAPLFVTLGSPLGVRAVLRLLRRTDSLSYPDEIRGWVNAYDTRDVVALRPISELDFPSGRIRNYPDVKNSSNDPHSISGYLSDKFVGREILAALGEPSLIAQK